MIWYTQSSRQRFFSAGMITLDIETIPAKRELHHDGPGAEKVPLAFNFPDARYFGKRLRLWIAAPC